MARDPARDLIFRQTPYSRVTNCSSSHAPTAFFPSLPSPVRFRSDLGWLAGWPAGCEKCVEWNRAGVRKQRAASAWERHRRPGCAFRRRGLADAGRIGQSRPPLDNRGFPPPWLFISLMRSTATPPQSVSGFCPEARLLDVLAGACDCTLTIRPSWRGETRGTVSSRRDSRGHWECFL